MSGGIAPMGARNDKDVSPMWFSEGQQYVLHFLMHNESDPNAVYVECVDITEDRVLFHSVSKDEPYRAIRASIDSPSKVMHQNNEFTKKIDVLGFVDLSGNTDAVLFIGADGRNDNWGAVLGCNHISPSWWGFYEDRSFRIDLEDTSLGVEVTDEGSHDYNIHIQGDNSVYNSSVYDIPDFSWFSQGYNTHSVKKVRLRFDQKFSNFTSTSPPKKL